MKPSYILFLAAGSALSLSGQKTFSGPASGYVFDSAGHSIRAVLGVPGAAYLGSPSESSWDLVSVAPNGNRALGVSGLSIDLIPDLSQPASFTTIAQAPGPISRIAWSGDSTTAAIWAPKEEQLWRISGLDSAPVVHDPIDLTALAGAPSRWNISGDGRLLALSSRAVGTASVYISDQDGIPVPIGSVADPGAIAFSADGASLFVFSAAENRILLLDFPSAADTGSFDASSFEVTGRDARLAGRHPNTSRVQDLAPSADGTRLYAIGGQTLCSYDLATKEMLSCNGLDISPSSLQAMPGGILLLNYLRAANTPLWLVDGKGGEIYFVPAGNATADASF